MPSACFIRKSFNLLMQMYQNNKNPTQTLILHILSYALYLFIFQLLFTVKVNVYLH